jgi:VWFA-related protein
MLVARRGRPALERLSRETGGGFYSVKQPVEAIYDRIQGELRHQYSIGYTPARAELDGRYRKIQLAVRDTGLTVQARDGYFAQ